MKRQSNVSRLHEAVRRAEIEHRDQTAILDDGLRLHVLALPGGIAIWSGNCRIELRAAYDLAEVCDELRALRPAPREISLSANV